MNMKRYPADFFRRAALVTLLVAALLPQWGLRSQPSPETAPGRYLFIFDTSSAMKKRAAAVQETVVSMLATSLGGQLKAGDTVGVWTFDQELRPADAPLQVWDPDTAAMITDNITQFLGSRKYENETRFEVLQPLLNRVMQNSPRLTVILFCDGMTPISGTTFDHGVNQLFQDKGAAQKKARQPFVVVLRSQRGQFVGCTLSCPPLPVSFPQFPPWPQPAPAPLPLASAAPSPAAPVRVVPSLILVGTKTITNRPPVLTSAPVAQAPTRPSEDLNPATSAPISSNPPPIFAAPIDPPAQPPASVPPPAAAGVANPPNGHKIAAELPQLPTLAAPPPAVAPSIPSASLSEVAAIPPPAPATPNSIPGSGGTPVSGAAADNPDAVGHGILLGLLVGVAAGGATIVAVFYFRRPYRRSLISSSMNDR